MLGVRTGGRKDRTGAVFGRRGNCRGKGGAVCGSRSETCEGRAARYNTLRPRHSVTLLVLPVPGTPESPLLTQIHLQDAVYRDDVLRSFADDVPARNYTRRAHIGALWGWSITGEA